MLPTVNFCGLETTRLLVGANPFGGYSHQNKELDNAMRDFHTVDVILDTWDRAYKAGINTFVTNNETPHVREAVHKYFANKGPMRWIAQISFRSLPSMEQAIDEVVEMGCSALFLHGGLIDQTYTENGEDKVRAWVKYAKSKGIPVGSAAHAPIVHRWLNSLDILDFHAVPFFNCGSVHSASDGHGERFVLEDPPKAVQVIREIKKPCIAYKILGAGRIDAAMGMDYAYRNIKPGDIVNLGMSRLYDDNIVEKDADIASSILSK